MNSHLDKPESFLKKQESFLKKLSKKNLLLISRSLYFAGIDEFSKEDIIGIILEIYEIYVVEGKHIVFIDKVDKVVIVFDTGINNLFALRIPLLEIHSYNKIIFDKGDIIVKKNKKIYAISKEINVSKNEF